MTLCMTHNIVLYAYKYFCNVDIYTYSFIHLYKYLFFSGELWPLGDACGTRDGHERNYRFRQKINTII